MAQQASPHPQVLLGQSQVLLGQILPLSSDLANLATAGGKGANLSKLVRAGFPVPPGFLITVEAYRNFLAANQLENGIQGLLAAVDANDPASLEGASSQIRALFSVGKLPGKLEEAILSAHTALAANAVAVRSSATAEDLPEMSFAGQQDTYLNVVGEENLLKAVVDCWSSLWTARAIGYRIRNRVAHASVSLAVVVQKMVESQASGVLFTANPLTGLRSETVIDATLGLGEALVSGQVQPDHYVVDPAQESILSKTLGDKTISIHGLPGGGTHVTEHTRGDIQALTDVQILDLARLSSQVAGLYGFPQDIEWAWADGILHILQARPITALFPLPAGLAVEPLKVFFSFAAVQGMLDPITPIGRDALKEIFAMGARLFGTHVTRETQSVLHDAGERLWVNFTPILANTVGRRIVPVVLGMVEPSIQQAVEQIWDDPRLQPRHSGISMQARKRLARFLLPLGFNILLNIASPVRRRQYIINNGEQILAKMESRCSAITGDRWQKLASQADLLPGIAGDFLPHTFLLFVSGVASGMASWNFLNMLAGKTAEKEYHDQSPNQRDLVLQVTRGMPYNPTTEMDLILWEMSKEIRHDPDSRQVFQSSTTPELTVRYFQGTLPQVTSDIIHQFLVKYGGRGFGEIDLGRLRWAEDPTHVFEMLASFLQIEDESQAPDAVFARAANSANEAVDQLVASIRKKPHGWIKSRLARFFAGRARQLMGLRESPKFFAVRLMYIFHRELLKSGVEFFQTGELDQPDDLFYLTFTELKNFASRQKQDWRGLVTERRENYQRELLRRQIPRLLLSDGRAYYEGISTLDSSENVVTGSPVSPGVVEGLVRVVLDPRQAGLQPGEILVCPGTDPSWTPLFLSAAGLVMEVGGMMTHGAVVAREYGIPAIVGVDKATMRLQTGQRIRVDGSSGQILILDDQILPTL